MWEISFAVSLQLMPPAADCGTQTLTQNSEHSLIHPNQPGFVVFPDVMSVKF